MAFSVTPDLVTGNDMIDSQHRELFKAINEFQDACKNKQGNERVSATMKFLVDYTAKHFGDEERLQQQSNYPDQINHKKLHEEFKSLVNDLSKQQQASEASFVVLTQLSNALGNWFMNHIMREDKKVAAHIRNQG
ncbi:MAG: bacteriohemerythrin [Oscillospiraceae bacterium]|nr:bacteriohemerythrin [Oscillospiraceae bacterium]